MGFRTTLNRNSDAFETALWFGQDFVLRFKYELTFITLLGVGAASIQAGTLAAANYLITAGVPVRLLELIPAELASVAVGGALLILLGLSALLTYFNGKRTLALWPRYQIHALNSLFAAINSASQRGVIESSIIRQSAIPNSLRTTQRLGSFSRIVTKSILPVLRFLGFLLFAFATNPVTTLIIFFVVTPASGFLLLYFSRHSAKCERRANALSRDASRQLVDYLNQNLSAAEPVFVGQRVGAQKIQIEQRIQHLVDRFVWVEKARLATAFLTIGLLAILVSVTGHGPDVKWGELAVYIIALMLAFLQLSNIASAFSSFGPFYPTVSRHRILLSILNNSRTSTNVADQLRRYGFRQGIHQKDDHDLE